MQDQFKDVVGNDEGVKSVRTGSYGGFKATVITGYNALSDTWPYHITVQKEGGRPIKLTEIPTTLEHSSERGAFSQGFAIAKDYIDRHNSDAVFQQEVSMAPRSH